MRKLYILATATLGLLMLSGCAHHPSTASSEKSLHQAESKTEFVSETPSSELAKRLVSQLIKGLDDTKEIQVGVTHFVETSGNYNSASPLSHLMGENLMHALVAEHIAVLDFKTMDYIRVTEEGDFALSKDYLELDEIMPLTHFLVGTMTEQHNGYLVNARVVEVKSNKVVSVGQILIPRHIAEELLTTDDEPTLRKS